MEFETILSAITTVGFPIVMCLVVFWYMTKESENHKNEMTELRNVISENNNILSALKQLIQDKLK